jgi:pilus assembly protein CpaB
MRRRVIALVAALALAGVGTLVLVSFVRSAEERAGAGEAEVTVWRVSTLATAPLGAGTRVGEAVDGGLIEQAEVDQDSLPLGSVQVLDDKLDKLLLVDMAPGEILLESKLGDVVVDESRTPDNLNVPVVEIPPGYVQVPVSFEPEQALGGLIQPGNEVSILATFTNYVTGQGGTSITVDGEGVVLPEAAGADTDSLVTGAATDVLLERVLVAAVQSDAPPAFQEEGSDVVLTPATQFLITFAVPLDDATRIAYAASQGELWLAYASDDSEGEPETPETPLVTIDNIFGEG